MALYILMTGQIDVLPTSPYVPHNNSLMIIEFKVETDPVT